LDARSSSPYISTEAAAQALGVSVSTIKRWVDDQILPAHKTVGGHRKLLRAEVLALARQGDLPRRDLTALSISTNGAGLNLEDLKAVLLDALLRGDAPEVHSIVARVHGAGLSVEVVADQLISPVMAQVGHEWEMERVDVWREHRATQVCASALFALKDDVEARTEKNRPLAIGGGIPGDPYLLATLLAQIVLLDAGWNAVNLGPNTPMESFCKVVRELRPRLVWISASHLQDERAFVAGYREFYKVAESLGTAVAVGGQAMTQSLRASLPYTTHGDGLAHLAAFARDLHPRPKRPKRGRPTKK
jgi:excisionase family DNA binding protein